MTGIVATNKKTPLIDGVFFDIVQCHQFKNLFHPKHLHRELCKLYKLVEEQSKI
jgi:hypothetical protein